jgi:hypothetical protein
MVARQPNSGNDAVVNAKWEPFEVFIGAAAEYEAVAHNQLGPLSGEAVAGMNGFFANPITLGQRCPICDRVHLETPAGRAEMTACFRRGLLDSPYWVTPNLETFRHLRHRILGCPCKLGPCHGDVYQELLDASGPTVPVWLR